MGSPLKFPVGCCSFRSKTTCNSASAIAVSSVYEEQSDTVDRFIESFGLDTALAGMGGTGGTTTGTQSSYSSELCDRLETAIDANDTDAASEMITLMASGEEPDPNDAATGNIVEPGIWLYATMVLEAQQDQDQATFNVALDLLRDECAKVQGGSG